MWNNLLLENLLWDNPVLDNLVWDTLLISCRILSFGMEGGLLEGSLLRDGF